MEDSDPQGKLLRTNSLVSTLRLADEEKITLFWTSGLAGESLGLGGASETQKTYPLSKAQCISDFYNITTNVGRGSFGIVRNAVHTASSTQCVVKTVDKNVVGPSYIEIHQRRDHFNTLLEMKKSNHPNIVKYLDFLMGPDYVFVVMEPLQGGELFDIIVESAPITDDFCREVMRQVLSAICVCHQWKVIHRDVKLESFACRSANKNARELALLDFGLSCPSVPQEKRDVVGTLLYTAPEVFSGVYSAQADLWSVGVMLYVMLTGEFPFDHDPDTGTLCDGFIQGECLREVFSRDVVAQLPPEAVDLLRGLLTMSPQNRLTATAAIEHHWLQLDGQPSSPVGAHRGKYRSARAMSAMSMATSSMKSFNMQTDGINKAGSFKKLSPLPLIRETDSFESDADARLRTTSNGNEPGNMTPLRNTSTGATPVHKESGGAVLTTIKAQSYAPDRVARSPAASVAQSAQLLVTPLLDKMDDDEAQALVQDKIHVGAKFQMQGIQYDGTKGYLQYRQVMRQAWKSLDITVTSSRQEVLPEQDRPPSHSVVRVSWRLEGVRAFSASGSKVNHNTKLKGEGVSLYTFDLNGKCVQAIDSHNANWMVEQLHQRIAELTRLQQTEVAVRTLRVMGRQKSFKTRIESRKVDGIELEEALISDDKKDGVSGTEMVLTMVNSMTGDFFLAIPWGLQQAGLMFGTSLICATAALTCYTAIVIIRLAEKTKSKGLAELSKRYLGRTGLILTHIMNLVLFVGTVCANFVFLEDNIVAISGVANTFGWGPALSSRQAVATVALVIFLISLKEDMTFFIQLNSLAALCSAYILGWQLTSCADELYVNGLPQRLPGYPGGMSFGVLPGMMAYTLLCHGWVLPVIATLEDKSRATTNLIKSFTITVVLLVIAALASVTAYGSNHQVPQNFLTNFDQTRLFPFTTVVALTIEATIFTPLMLLLSKETLQEMVYGSSESDVPSHVKFGLNVVIIAMASLVAVYFPNVGDVMGWAGAVCGLFLGFLFPMLFNLIENEASLANCIGNGLVICAGFSMFALQIASACA